MAEMRHDAAIFDKSRSQTEQSTMKLKEMTPEQRREYNRVQKQQQRDREREEAAAKRIPNANDFEMPEAKQKLLDQHSSEILKTIRAELPDHKFMAQDEYVIEATAHVVFGLENNIVQKVERLDSYVQRTEAIAARVRQQVDSANGSIRSEFQNIVTSAAVKALRDALENEVAALVLKLLVEYQVADIAGDPIKID
jgi:hypothetical protein